MTILAIVAPATIIGLMFGALSVCKRGKELSEDPEYLKKVQEGLFANSEKAKAIGVDGGSTFSAKLSVVIFEGEENFVGDSEIIALGGASNETKDRPLG